MERAAATLEHSSWFSRFLSRECRHAGTPLRAFAAVAYEDSAS